MRSVNLSATSDPDRKECTIASTIQRDNGPSKEHTVPQRMFFTGRHKPSEQTQAAKRFQNLLQLTDELWPIVTAW